MYKTYRLLLLCVRCVKILEKVSRLLTESVYRAGNHRKRSWVGSGIFYLLYLFAQEVRGLYSTHRRAMNLISSCGLRWGASSRDPALYVSSLFPGMSMKVSARRFQYLGVTSCNRSKKTLGRDCLYGYVGCTWEGKNFGVYLDLCFSHIRAKIVCFWLISPQKLSISAWAARSAWIIKIEGCKRPLCSNNEQLKFAVEEDHFWYVTRYQVT